MNKVKDEYHEQKKQTFTTSGQQIDKLSWTFAYEIITDSFIDL